MKKGFTLLELIIVVIVIGILVSIALPKFITVTEKARAADAFAILGTMRSAQLRYYGQYGDYSADCTILDVTTTTSRYFNTPTCAAADPIVSVLRLGGAYTLTIDEDGTIKCGAGGACPPIGN
jgi:type IV pilus assembly protein PilE